MNDQTPIRRRAAKQEPSGDAVEPMGRMAKKLADAEADPHRAERIRQWQAENAEAIASSNAWVRKHGIPLAPYRKD